MPKKRRLDGLKFSPPLNCPVLKDEVGELLLDARAASPFLSHYLEHFWPEFKRFRNLNVKGHDGKIRRSLIEVRCLTKSAFVGLQKNKGSGRDCDYQKLMASTHERDAYIICDITERPWTCVMLKSSDVRQWIRSSMVLPPRSREIIVNSQGDISWKKFWAKIDSDYKVAYREITCL